MNEGQKPDSPDNKDGIKVSCPPAKRLTPSKKNLSLE
jgi:hypothetical protein